MRVRFAVEADIPQVLPLMRGLAEFENTIASFAYRLTPDACQALIGDLD